MFSLLNGRVQHISSCFGIAMTDFFFAAITIFFAETSYTASEGVTPLKVCGEIVSLMGTLDCDLVVTFSVLPGSAGMTIKDFVITCWFRMI